MKKITFLINLLWAMNASAQAPPIQWQKCYGGNSSEDGREILALSDGSFVLVGHSNSINGDTSENHGISDVWVVKIDSAGSIIWQKSFGGSEQEFGHSLVQTSDGGFLIVAETLSNDQQVSGNHGSFDVYMIKIDGSGNLQWTKTLGGSGADLLFTIRPTSDGGFIAAGQTDSSNGDVTFNHGTTDCWIIKFNADGNLSWQKTYGGSSDDLATSIRQTTDNGYIFTGQSKSINGDVTQNYGNYDVWVVKIDTNGTLQWQKNYGGSNLDTGSDIITTADGGYMVASISSSSNNDLTSNHGSDDLWLVKTDSTGNIQWQKSYGGSNSDGTFRGCGSKIWQMADGGYTIAGYASGNGNNGDITGAHGVIDQWLIRINATGSLLWNKCLGGSSTETIHHLQMLADNTFMTIGTTASNNGDVTSNHGSADLWLVKLGQETLAVTDFQYNAFPIYPNPADSQLQLPEDMQFDMFKIIDMLGKNVLQQKGESRFINIESLPSGTYILQAFKGGKKFQTKFIKQ